MADVNGCPESTPQEDIKNPDVSNIKTEKNGEIKSTDKPDEVSVKEEPKVEMDPQVRAKKIKRQIEYYFGDFNLPTDKFLREEVKKKDGWIPLETMIKFKRLAALSTDPTVIVEALSGSELVEVSEDKTEVRRNPDKPLPEDNEARRKEVMLRTVYVKGFPQEDFTIDNALDYFEEFGPTDDVVMRFWQDKATKTWKFKGSVFVKFPTREEAAAFLAREEVKYKDEVLIRLWQEEYIENKRKERLEQKMQRKRKAPGDNEEKDGEEEKGLPKNATLHMTNISEGLSRETLKERLEEMGVIVAFIEYNKGDQEGWIRLHEAGTAANVMKECEEGKLKVKDGLEVTLRALEGDEEAKFLESAKNSINARRAKGGRNQRGRRGGRGGRGGGNWRKRRHDNENYGEPHAKSVKTEDSDGDD